MQVFDLEPGTKVAIRLLQTAGPLTMGIRQYETSVSDVKPDGILVCDVPIEGGKLLMLPRGVRYEFRFSAPQGFYLAVGEVDKVYKESIRHLMDVKLISPLQKFQRREYFRIECNLPAFCMTLGDRHMDLSGLTDPQDFEEFIDRKAMQGTMQTRIMGHGVITNVSGGGVHFVSTLDTEDAGYALLRCDFQDGDVDFGTMELLCKVLDKEYDLMDEMFSYRMKFLFPNPKFRERIVQFVFEEERKTKIRTGLGGVGF